MPKSEVIARKGLLPFVFYPNPQEIRVLFLETLLRKIICNLQVSLWYIGPLPSFCFILVDVKYFYPDNWLLLSSPASLTLYLFAKILIQVYLVLYANSVAWCDKYIILEIKKLASVAPGTVLLLGIFWGQRTGQNIMELANQALPVSFIKNYFC